MRGIDEVREVLSRMILLLGEGGGEEWAKVLTDQLGILDSDPDVAALNILSMYGGMGSLNDVVLYKDGKVLVGENNELDILRERLYQLFL